MAKIMYNTLNKGNTDKKCKLFQQSILRKEGFIMVQRRIMLRPDMVKEFVAKATKCDFDIDIFYNRYVVDAKSILGVLGLDFRQILTVSYNGYNEEFESFLNSMAVAC